MSTYRLDKIFSPRSVALVGGSPRDKSVGRQILKNLRECGFPGPLYLVNSRHAEIDGTTAVSSIEQLPEMPDVVIIAVAPDAVPDAVAAAGKRGIPGAIIVTAGLGHGPGSHGAAAAEAARTHGVRLIGPNCLGVMIPKAKLNAGFAAHAPRAGDLALISQSGAIAAGMVEWASRRNVGFSAVVSLGDQIDVDIGDCLDFFAVDPSTNAILLYIEAVRDARKFMSAARAAARAKPVVVVKSGRHAQGARAAATHTGAMAGSDAVYDAAFRRAGLLRVRGLDQLFAAAETLGHKQPYAGKRLAILTNGGGVGVLAVDRLTDLGGVTAELSPATVESLDKVLPPTWSRANPIDIVGDADAERYATAFEILLSSPDNDAVLVMNVPTALASATNAAEAIVGAAQKHHGGNAKPVLAVWIGADELAASSFEKAGIPHFTNESEAVEGFSHLVEYREARDSLMQTPSGAGSDVAPDVAAARRTVRLVLDAGRIWLDPVEIVQLLTAYRIPIAAVTIAKNADDAVAAAEPLLSAGHSVAVKILSPDITHKSDIGGVRLGLTSAEAVAEAASDVLARARIARPDARITGVTVHSMIVRPNARELIAGVAVDPTFGPVIVFGAGGTAVEVVNDKALALPPLNIDLARDLMSRTRVSRILKGYRNVAAADQQAIASVLVMLAQLVADLPEIRELDLNPLLADKDGVIAIDARIAVEPVQAGAGLRLPGHPRFAIRPYPREWDRIVTMRDGTIVRVRPIRPEDEPLYDRFFSMVTHEDRRLRFFAPIRSFNHAFLARFAQIDYARAMAFIAIDPNTGDLLGVARLFANSTYDSAEFANLVRSDLKGRGFGWLLMQTIIEYARAEGLTSIEGQVLRENTTMINMCRELGFRITPDGSEVGTYHVKLSLDATADMT